MQKAMQQFAQLNISPLSLVPGYNPYTLYTQVESWEHLVNSITPHTHPHTDKHMRINMHTHTHSHAHTHFVQLLQQQVAGLAGQSATYGQSTLGVSGLLSPTSPTHGASPLSSNSSGTGLASPGLTTIPTLPSLPPLSNGLPTLSPNGLSASADLQSPLHR